MQNSENNFTGNNTENNALKQFQLSGDVKSKSDKKFGDKIILQCEEIINSEYFKRRNDRIALNRALAEGQLDTKKFMDFFNVDGKTNYMNINWKSIMIVNTIISRLVGRWMTKKEKASVTAIDPISTNKKKEEYDDSEFYLSNKEQLLQHEQDSGVEIIPKEAFIPDDKDHLDFWRTEEQRLPEEILYEIGINTVFDDNDFGDMGTNQRAIKHDSATAGLIGAETTCDKSGKIIIRKCVPENMFYSFSERDDFADASIKGEIVSYKISQIRDLYPNLEIKDLYEIAKISKQWNTNNKLDYNPNWNTNMFLPFDEWNVDVSRFTLRTLDVDKTLIKTAKDGSLYVDKPKKKIDVVYDGNEYIEKKIWNIYRGVYVRGNKKMLEWGLEKNSIRSQKYEKIGDAKSPFCFYMYQNRKMRNLAVPEKIEEPVEQMILSRLKIQQLVAKMRPSGYQYDIDGLQAMDLGNGIVKPLELRKITDQSGDVYFRSRDMEGNRIDSPVRELPNAGSVAQLQALIETYNYHLQVLRDEIGINEFAEGQSIKPRVGVQNVQSSLEISFNATDYMNDACISLKDEIADNIACLLHDSVEFGSEQYRDLLKEEDVKLREFKVKIEMLPTTDEITSLENDLDVAMKTQPDLILYLNPQKIKRIARKNVKMAELYFRRGQKRAIEGASKSKQQDSEMNARLQQESNQQAAEKAIELQRAKLEQDKEMEEFRATRKKEELLLQGLLAAAAKDESGRLIAQFFPALQQLVPNITMPLAAENQQMQQEMLQPQEQPAQQQEIVQQ